jgi:hypothetical protein
MEELSTANIRQNTYSYSHTIYSQLPSNCDHQTRFYYWSCQYVIPGQLLIHKDHQSLFTFWSHRMQLVASLPSQWPLYTLHYFLISGRIVCCSVAVTLAIRYSTYNCSHVIQIWNSEWYFGSHSLSTYWHLFQLSPILWGLTLIGYFPFMWGPLWSWFWETDLKLKNCCI